MTAYNCILQPSMFVEDTLRCSATIADNTEVSPVDICALESVLPLGESEWDNQLPIARIEYGYVGIKVLTFVDDYYYRIHVDPMRLNFGAIISPLQEELLVWNAYFVPKTCAEIIEFNGDEWELSGETPPFELAPLGHTIFTLDLPLQGSATFEGSITFNFADANEPVVVISGTRLILFAWRPQSPLTEHLKWLTNTLPSKDGSLQRICLRQAPRQQFKFPLLIETDQEQAALDAALFSWQKRAWGLPIWSEMVVHTATITAEDTVISVDTTNADFRDGGLAVIWQSSTLAEVVQVETVAADSLTLSSPVQNTFTGRKVIMPCRTAQMHAPVTRQIHSSGPAMIEAFFAVKDNIELTGYTPAVTYKGLAVLTEGIPVDPTQQKSSDGDMEVTDYETGDFEYFSDSEFNIRLQSHLFYNDTKAACWQFRLFLHSLYGRQGTVYIPTYKNDLSLAEGFGASDTSFNIVNIGLADNMGVNDLRTDLAFIFPDGTQLYREITGIVDSGSEEIVSIDADLDVAVEPGDCVICFLDKVCLAADDVELVWTAAHENRCQLDWQAVKA